MKKLMAMAATAAVLTSVCLSGFAATSSWEEKCKVQAEKHKIGEDKLDAYVKTCVAKHMKHMKRVKYVKHEKKAEPKAAAPAAAAPAPTPATSAEPAK